MTYLNNILLLLQSLFYTFFNLENDNLFSIIIAVIIVSLIFGSFINYIFPKS